MTRDSLLATLAVSLPLLSAPVALADGLATDANIVTCIDISDSMNAEEIRLELEGVARAVQSPDVLAAIRRGPRRRIGFAVFAWHHFRYAIVGWTLIASERDALAVADTLAHQVPINVEPGRQEPVPERGRFTDISRAIDHAWDMVGHSPFTSERLIINIIGNGKDNMGEDAMFARNRVVERGATVNGVVIGDAPTVRDYYRRNVIGGPGSFVISTSQATGIIDAMMRKFLQEIAIAEPNSPR